MDDTLGGSIGGLYIFKDTSLPTSADWIYWDDEKMQRDNDTSLTLEFTSLSPCQVVRVAGEDDVVEKVGDWLGDDGFAFIS